MNFHPLGRGSPNVCSGVTNLHLRNTLGAGDANQLEQRVCFTARRDVERKNLQCATFVDFEPYLDRYGAARCCA